MNASRRAVAGMFLLNGLGFSNVLPRLPAIKSDLALSNTALGAAVAAAPVGALLATPICGWLIARYGSAQVAVVSAVLAGTALPLIAIAPLWPALAAAFLVLGAADSLMDVSMNAQALWVQRVVGRSIINTMHGVWSIGATAGGLLGAASAGLRLRLEVHLLIAGAFVAASALVLNRWLMHGDEPAADAPVGEGRAPTRRRSHRLALLGLVVVMAAVIEDAPASWGAVFLRDDLGTSAAVAGLAFVGFQSMMTCGRLIGDRLVDRWGEAAVVRASGVLIVGGMTLAVGVARPVAVIVGFAIAGLGASPLFPLVFHAAGNMADISTGHGLAAVSWFSRVGFLLSPPIVGAVADALELRAALILAPLAGLLVLAIGPAIVRPDRPQ